MEREFNGMVKPWGEFVTYAHNEKCTVKLITVKEDQMLSDQSHKKRDELWIIVSGNGTVELDGEEIDYCSGDRFTIPAKTRHRMHAFEDTLFLEVSFGHFDEKDIKRYDDAYGRK